MITNNGKQIIAKFLLGQAPEFATHIAAGCGSVPLFPNQTLSESKINELKDKKALDFEAFRVPISSKGLIKEDGLEKIVFKAEMPTEQRYQISEVAFFPADRNTVAGVFDSKSLSTFTPDESWVIASINSSSNVLSITNDQDLADSSDNIITNDLAFFMQSDSAIFDNSDRKSRQEPPRYYTNSLAISGSSSYISSFFNVDSSSYRIENSSIAYNLSQNLPTDQIKLAISVISRTANNDTAPDTTRIVFDFVNNLAGLDLESPKARATAELLSTDFVVPDTGQSPDPQSRYAIITKPISDFTVDDTFSWANVNLIRIYACTLDSGDAPTSDYIIAIDGLRLENISSINPIYSMVGYNIIRNDFSYPILKAQNTNNYIEYRFNVGVDT